MKFLFLFFVIALVAFVNADTRAKCMSECGVEPYMVKRVLDLHDFQFVSGSMKRFMLCYYKEEKKIFVEHDIHDEIHRLQELVDGRDDCHGVEICKGLSGHTYEELAWNYAKCVNYNRQSKRAVAFMHCADELGMSKKIVEELVEHHNKVSTKGDKKKEFYFCFFQHFGVLTHDGTVHVEALKTMYGKTHPKLDFYEKSLKECKKTCNTSWDIIKCFVAKYHESKA